MVISSHQCKGASVCRIGQLGWPECKIKKHVYVKKVCLYAYDIVQSQSQHSHNLKIAEVKW